jgi:hypothetical protein
LLIQGLLPEQGERGRKKGERREDLRRGRERERERQREKREGSGTDFIYI